jgi:glycosyltransferase involved in cell wall biosynthesis
LEMYDDIFSSAGKSGNKLIASSYHTKYVIQSYFPSIPSENILMLYPAEKEGIIHKESLSELVEGIIDKNAKYFLMLSCNRAEKNAESLVKAFDGKDKKWDGYVCVMVGILDEKIKAKIECPERFINIDLVNESELEALYKNASAVVYPTFGEGFGYPPIEAMKYGTPVICSAVTSVAEVVGNAALLFNPYNHRELEARFRQFIDMDRDVISSKANIRYQEISFLQKKSLKKTIDMLIGK